MYRRNIEDRSYIIAENIEKIGNIKHGFTTARGGFSTGKVEGLNLGFRVGDERENVLKNYKAVSNDLGLSYENMVLSKQSHTANVRIVTKADAGKGIMKESDIFDTDGLITNEKNIPLVIFSADCIPILLADKSGKAVGAVHAGWRGTVSKIPEVAVLLIKENYGVKPEDIVASIGPGIGACCFEVSEDVASEFDDEFVTPKLNGKYMVDLKNANVKTLESAGVLRENISVANICTKCNFNEFYSYRAMGDRTGRMGAIIEIK